MNKKEIIQSIAKNEPLILYTYAFEIFNEFNEHVATVIMRGGNQQNALKRVRNECKEYKSGCYIKHVT